MTLGKPLSQEAWVSIEFTCPSCDQLYSVEDELAGHKARCEVCDTAFIVPGAGQALDESSIITGPDAASPDAVTLTSSRDINPGNVTISQYISARGLEGGVELGDAPGVAAVSALTQGERKRYTVGGMVARGGMGAIFSAKDLNVRRTVAMKVMLDPKQADETDILRFIEEAQVTGQLEHPSVVPVYELGVDGSGNVFYTMKFVQGTTLKDVLGGIANGDRAIIAKYPLSHLLTTFLKACDAVAFAHSKGVVHRDLKPENIMVGDFGEVLVMDWGLAKVLAGSTVREAGNEEAPGREPASSTRGAIDCQLKAAIDSVRSDESGDVLRTMDGQVMGTPAFMAPEQAQGKVSDIDARTDVYALGAILYDILALRPPVQGDDVMQVLRKAAEGDITAPVELKSSLPGSPRKLQRDRAEIADIGELQRQATAARERASAAHAQLSSTPFPHCPNGRIPSALSAVAMKALATRQDSRYATVQELQAEIEAYQGGFATAAEEAGAARQVWLLLRRHRTAAAGAVAAVLALAVGLVLALVQWRGAETARGQAQQNLSAFRKAEARRLREAEASAPAYLRVARGLVERSELEAALLQADTALQSDPDLVEARAFRAGLHLCMKNWDGAQQDLSACLAVAPEKQRLQELQTALAAAREAGDLTPVIQGSLFGTFHKMHAYGLAAQVASGADELMKLYRPRIEEAWPGLRGCLTKHKDGGLYLEFRNRKEVHDLSPIEGMQLRGIDACLTLVDDLLPLAGMPLRMLDLQSTPVVDISILKGMDLETLQLNKTKVWDITPLAGMESLRFLDLGFLSRVGDLSPLAGMQVQELRIWETTVADLSPLRGMPLKRLDMRYARRVRDLSPLEGLPIEQLKMTEVPVVDLSPLAGMPLRELLAQQTLVSDLSPLSGMPLEVLSLDRSERVADISVLHGMPLRQLGLARTAVRDLSPLEGMELESLSIGVCANLKDLRPLTRLSVKRLTMTNLGPTDFTSLAGAAFESLQFSPAQIKKGMDVLRTMKTLKTIRCDDGPEMTVKEFWRRYDAGEFAGSPAAE